MNPRIQRALAGLEILFICVLTIASTLIFINWLGGCHSDPPPVYPPPYNTEVGPEAWESLPPLTPEEAATPCGQAFTVLVDLKCPEALGGYPSGEKFMEFCQRIEHDPITKFDPNCVANHGGSKDSVRKCSIRCL